MDTPERSRHREVVRRIAKQKKQFDRIYFRWLKMNQEKQELQAELRRLHEEREDLEQGQMILLSDAG